MSEMKDKSEKLDITPQLAIAAYNTLIECCRQQPHTRSDWENSHGLAHKKCTQELKIIFEEDMSYR